MQTPRDISRIGGNGPSQRTKVVLGIVAVGGFILLTSLRGISGFYTDYLWFDSLGFKDVFTGVLSAKVALAAIFVAIAFVLVLANLIIAGKLAPPLRPSGPEEEVLERYREMVGERTTLLRVAAAFAVALFVGVGMSARWHDWVLFTNAQDFGITDPRFKTDVGFYVFQLPFMTGVLDWAFAVFVLLVLVTVAAHYLNGGIRLQVNGERVSPQVKAHISVLLGAIALIKAVGYWLERYELNFSTRGVVNGATYTDVNAQLPALMLLTLISLAAFVLFIVNIWRRGWALPVLAVGLWALVALLIGGAYPAFIQRFQVEPSESSKEAPYIKANIEATRVGLGLDKVETKAFDPSGDLTLADLENNAETIRNIRLWDPTTMESVYQQLQEVQNYYQITDVDVDRYEVDGRLTQMLVAARQLKTEGVPQKSWEAQHLTYTHGYGAVVAPSNSKTENGRPNLLLQDIPLRSSDPSLELDKPGVYVGEGIDSYVVVNTDRKEIDFQDRKNETSFTEYDGADGVGIGSFMRKAAFALRFSDYRPLISGNLRSSSKILYVRDVRERLQTLAPFLSIDADPYPVLVDGRMVYIVDAYTTTNRYPSAQQASIEQLSPNSGLAHSFNYVRNSVKAVVDAYDGTVTLYVVDQTDPLIKAYQQAFPDMFTSGDKVPPALQAHFRYPDDLFRVQTNMWGRYHLTNPDDFYNQSSAWTVAQDPGTTGAPSSSQQVLPPDGGTGQGQIVASRQARMEPYYLLMRLPESTREEFLMLRPFVPVSDDDSKKQLTAFMVAKSDPGEYGKLVNYELPTDKRIDGPALVAATIQADTAVSQLETLLGSQGGGSAVNFGNLIVVPIEKSVLYVRPLYVEAESTNVPLLRKVIVWYKDRVVVEDTLELALIKLFGSSPSLGEEPVVQEPGVEEPGVVTPGPVETPPATTDVGALLEQAQKAFDEAQVALTAGDLAGYQRKNEEAKALVRQAADAIAADPGTSS
ncbi:MAG: UPF0182 family membrane protein [Acidimicrobiales bacterium]